MKKVLSLVLVAVMVLGMTSVAFAAVTDTVQYSLGTSAQVASSESLDVKINVSKVVNVFLFDNAGKALTKDDIRDSKITYKVKTTAGGSLLAANDLKYESGTNGAAYIRLTFVEPFVSTKEQDYEYTIYVLYNKARSTQEFTLTGTVSNESQPVGDGDDYVYVYDIPVVTASDYIKKIEVDLGQGVSIFARMFQDKKYYGYVSQEIKTADIEISDKYPAIETVYYVSTIGLNNSGDVVKFDLDETMYVYAQDEEGNLVYLGRSNKLLPYYTKYFIASKELDIAPAVTEPDVIPEPDATTPGDTDNAGTGGDDVIANVNDNPGTGC